MMRSLLRRLIRRPSAEEGFFSKPLSERREEVKRLYSAEKKMQALQGYFDRTNEAIDEEIRLNFRYFPDIVLGYAATLSPATVLQLGCYTASELQALRHGKFQGRLIGSDHSASYLDFLKTGFARTMFDGFDYRAFDLDDAQASDFEGVDMVTAMAVLSNVQPESFDQLFGAMRDAGVRTVLIGDMYTQSSLSAQDKAASDPLISVRNWCHPYRSYAARYGYDAIFLPEATYSSFKEARGIFILTRDVDAQTHLAAQSLALQRYLGRQNDVWNAYGQG